MTKKSRSKLKTEDQPNKVPHTESLRGSRGLAGGVITYQYLTWSHK